MVQQLLPRVLQAPVAQSVPAMQEAAVAAAASGYTQVAVLLLQELGRTDPSAVAAVADQLQGREDGACRALLSAVVLQWAADCAGVPQQQQQQIRREQAEADALQRHVQQLCLSVAVALGRRGPASSPDGS